MLNNPILADENPFSLIFSREDRNFISTDFCLECKLHGKKCLTCLECESHQVSVEEEEQPKKMVEGDKISSTPRHKKRPNYICTAHCRYDIVRQIASKFGMRESMENWNVLWSDYLVSCERVKNLKRYQKINHFPGMGEICRKDLLARNLNRMYKVFPKDYEFFPRTWLLPYDLGDVTDYAKRHKHTTYILKPDVGCKGKGIQLTKNVKDLASLDRTICQIYVTKPYLIDGFKFDLRLYVLITSCDPLRLYVYNEGLVRFATKRFKEPTKSNMNNMYMHLTNYSVNKFSRTYVADPEEGSKRKLTTLNDYLLRQSHDVGKLWEDIDDVIIKTVLLALPTLQHNYRAAFPSHQNRQACFELLGFDLILDSTMKPYLLEVNHSPSFHTDAPIDREVKEALIADTFKILNLPKNIKQSVILEDKRIVTNRLLKELQNPPPSLGYQNNVKNSSSEELLKKYEQFEYDHKGNFRKIYPNQKMQHYSVFYCQGTSSLFNETFASRARERVSKLMKEGIQESELFKLKPFEDIVSQFTKRSKSTLRNKVLPRTNKWQQRSCERIISTSDANNYFRAADSHVNNDPPSIRQEICNRVASHNTLRRVMSINSDIPSLLQEKTGIHADPMWNNLYTKQNDAFLNKVHDYSDSKIKLKYDYHTNKWDHRSCEKIISTLDENNTFRPSTDTEFYESNEPSDTGFHWDVHFGIDKKKYKLDSFPCKDATPHRAKKL